MDISNIPTDTEQQGEKDGAGYTEIIEGQASMLYDVNEIVFYNKVQVLNRDLSIQMISHFSQLRQQEWAAIAKKKSSASKFVPPEGIVILDALAATGLRTIRYLKEIPGVKSVVINDFLPEATAAASKNVIRNGVSLDRYILLSIFPILLAARYSRLHVHNITCPN